jgi:hypothetical protein
MRTQVRRLKPRRNLRGERLKEVAIRELEATETWRQDVPLSWQALASRLGVSRQSVAKKPAVVEAFHRAKATLRKHLSDSPEVAVRRTLEQYVEELRLLLREKDRVLDSWIEKWVTIEHNCRSLGYDADKVLQPLVRPSRGAK